MKLKVNDKVLIIAGKDKGKVGKITHVIPKHNRIVVESVNIRIKHIKKTQTAAGQKISFEAPFSVSNAMILDPSNNKPTRIGYKKLDNGKKERFSKISNTSLDNLPMEAKVTATPKKKIAEKEAAKDTKETTKPESKSRKTIVKA